MPDISGGSSFESKESVAEQTRAQRESFIRSPDGDLIGNNFVIPKGDFGKFLGYKKETPEEANGQKPLSGSRVIELSLQQEMNELGMGAAKHGNAYRNIGISWGRFNNEPGREKDMIKDGIDAIRQGPEKNIMEDNAHKIAASTAPYFEQLKKIQQESRNDNIKYMEMQYRFQEMSKQHGTISNLMKTRHDCVSRTIRGNQ